MKIGLREVGEIVRGCVDRKKSSFLGSPRDVFRRPSAAPEPIAPKFLHTTFPSKYFVIAEFHHPRLSFGGVMAPTPSSHRYNMACHIVWQAIMTDDSRTTHLRPGGSKAHVPELSTGLCHISQFCKIGLRR